MDSTGSGLVYSTYLGGSDWDSGFGAGLDGAANLYVTGSTWSSDFPTTTGALQENIGGLHDAFVAKLNAAGSALIYSTYLGGTYGDSPAFGIGVDTDGNAYVAGGTDSADFPITENAVQSSHAGGSWDAFVAKLNATGVALIYSTYLGGSGRDHAFGFTVDALGNAYVMGDTNSVDFPVTEDSCQPVYGGGDLDAFVAKLNTAGSALLYSTYLGGDQYDESYGIVVDALGNAYMTGGTNSEDFPTTQDAAQALFGGGSEDAFLAKLNTAGSTLIYSTYVGGSEYDLGCDIVLDTSGNAYVTGFTESADFPTVNPLQPDFGGEGDAFVAKFIFNKPPEAQPAPSSQTVELGLDPIVVIADVSDFDGDTLTYEWLKGEETLASGAVETIEGGDAVPIPDLTVPAGDPRFPLGEHVIELRVNDGVNESVSAFVSVEVTDTTAPSLSPIPSVTILWPPNHELVPVTIWANAFDNGGGAIIVSVDLMSSEPPDTDGDGNTIPDYYIDSVDDETGIIELRLRSERAGTGDGRTYTITIRATLAKISTG